MPVEVFLDSNVLIYSLVDDEARRERAQQLVAAGAVVSAQVLAETAAVLRRKFGLPPTDVTQALLPMLETLVGVPVDASVVLAALRIAERLGYSHDDSQIIASALQAKCTSLYSEDMAPGQLIDGTLRISNPFLA